MPRILFIARSLEGRKDTAGGVRIRSEASADVSRRRRSLLQPMPVPNRSFARVGCHLEILRQLQTIGGTSILTKSAKHAARGVVGKCSQNLAPRGIVALP